MQNYFGIRRGVVQSKLVYHILSRYLDKYLIYERNWSMAATHVYVYVGYFGEYIADFLQPSSSYSDDIETNIDQLPASDFHLTPRLARRG